MSSPNNVAMNTSVGLTNKEYACILLGLPYSGTSWLDALITLSIRQNLKKDKSVKNWDRSYSMEGNVNKIMGELGYEKDAN